MPEETATAEAAEPPRLAHCSPWQEEMVVATQGEVLGYREDLVEVLEETRLQILVVRAVVRYSGLLQKHGMLLVQAVLDMALAVRAVL